MGDKPDPNGTEQRLQDSSRAFLIELDRLKELEDQKSAMSRDDPDRFALAQEIEDGAQGLTSLSRYQTRLIGLQQASLDVQDAPKRPQATILGEWRDAERRLHEANAASARASDEADRLREEYRRGTRD
jgi:hypothetical protein